MVNKELDWKKVVLDDEAFQRATETLIQIARTIDTRGKKGLSWVKPIKRRPLEK